MICFFNHNWTQESEVTLSTNDRAFLYGDGIFETIRVKNASPVFPTEHFQRLFEGTALLRMDFPFSERTFLEHLENLITRNSGNEGKVRVHCWRKEGGTYTPKVQNTHILMTFQATPLPGLRRLENYGIVKLSKASHSPISALKSKSALPYVLAGMEGKEKNLDETILVSTEGTLIEALTSNLWWVKNDQLHTPSLETGCINGTIRKLLTRDYTCVEGAFNQEELEGAEFLFTTNAMIMSYHASANKAIPPLVSEIWQRYYA